MSPSPVWQESLPSWDWERLSDFLADRLPEGLHIEYKQPAHNPQNKKWEMGPELVETVVAMANTDGGLLVVGVAEDEEKRPSGIVGISHRDPENAFRNYCADAVEPNVPLDLRAIEIPSGAAEAGKFVLLIRMRRGNNPPYLLRRHGVFIRYDDQDRHASVRELEVLFQQRRDIGGQERSRWSDVERLALGPLSSSDPDKPLLLAVALTPTFPIPPVALDSTSEEHFQLMVRECFGSFEVPFMEPDGFLLIPEVGSLPGPPPHAASAYSDGSVALRTEIGSPGGPKRIDPAYLWSRFRHSLEVAARWPRDVCGVSGPLHFSVGLGNIADAVLELNKRQHFQAGVVGTLLGPPPRRNTQTLWVGSGEWEQGVDANDLIERAFESLARQLQCRFYAPLRGKIREWSAEG